DRESSLEVTNMLQCRVLERRRKLQRVDEESRQFICKQLLRDTILLEFKSSGYGRGCRFRKNESQTAIQDIGARQRNRSLPLEVEKSERIVLNDGVLWNRVQCFTAQQDVAVCK